MNEQIFGLYQPAPSFENQFESNQLLPMAKVPYFPEDFCQNLEELEDKLYNTEEYLVNNFPLNERNDDDEQDRHSKSFDEASKKDLEDQQYHVDDIEDEPEVIPEWFNFGRFIQENHNNTSLSNANTNVNTLTYNPEFCLLPDVPAFGDRQISQISKFTDENEDNNLKVISRPSIRKIGKKSKSLKIKSKNEEKKNIHRYMIRQVIRSLASEEFKTKVMALCAFNNIDYEAVKQYYLGQIENFTSIQLLSEHWSVDPLDFSEENKTRMVFKEFSKWFLKERAIRYILEGKMSNKKKYIHYKNHIMLYYVDHPRDYKSNNKKKKC